MCVSVCICLAGFTWPEDFCDWEKACSPHSPEVPPHSHQWHSLWKVHGDQVSAPTLRLFFPIICQYSGFLCLILSPTQRGANSHLSPPLLDATVLQRITLPQHMDAVPGPCSRAVFSQFSVQGHSTRVHCRAPKHSLSLLQGWEVLIDFLQRHTAVLGSVKSKEYVTQNSL